MMEQAQMSNKQIGKCSLCHAPIYAGEPRRGIWRLLLPPRITRTCVCFDVMLSTIQHSLVMGAPMPGALVLMPVREESE